MSIGAVGEKFPESKELADESAWGIWYILSSIFSLLTTSYNVGYQSGLSLSKSGSHLINRGTIEGTYNLSLNYTSVTNYGLLTSSSGDLLIQADELRLEPGSKVEGKTVCLDARRIVIDGADVLTKEAMKVDSCQEIILRGLSPESPTWRVLDELPSGCTKTITTSLKGVNNDRSS